MRRRKSNLIINTCKTENPMKEMSWCFKRGIYVFMEPNPKQPTMFRVVIKQGDNTNESDYKYTVRNIQDIVFDAYRELYKRNYGKKEI